MNEYFSRHQAQHESTVVKFLTLTCIKNHLLASVTCSTLHQPCGQAIQCACSISLRTAMRKRRVHFVVFDFYVGNGKLPIFSYQEIYLFIYSIDNFIWRTSWFSCVSTIIHVLCLCVCVFVAEFVSSETSYTAKDSSSDWICKYCVASCIVTVPTCIVAGQPC